jgi:hypothetical protein
LGLLGVQCVNTGSLGCKMSSELASGQGRRRSLNDPESP